MNVLKSSEMELKNRVSIIGSSENIGQVTWSYIGNLIVQRVMIPYKDVDEGRAFLVEFGGEVGVGGVVVGVVVGGGGHSSL